MEEDKLNTLFAGLQYDLQLLGLFQTIAQRLEQELQSSMIDKFEALVAKQPKKPFVIYDDLVYTYEAIDNLACRVTNIAKTWNLRPQDSVAIMIQNEPSFIYTFLGLQKLGIPVAFINTNLRAQPLIHSLRAAESKVLIVGSGEELLAAVTDILPELGNIPVYAQGVRQQTLPAGIQSIDVLMRDIYLGTPSPAARSGVTQMDPCCFIYTSGTTGNPKPVIVSQMKACMFCTISPNLLGKEQDDVTYIVIPLYHTTGFFIGFGGALVQGSTVVLRKKFSAQHFWSDCRRYKVTTVPYVGEVMRYLVSQPKSELDGVHNIRGIAGNGLRADIWKVMTERFKIPKISEVYGSTEGVGGTFNIFGKPGAVGRLSPFISRLDPDGKALIKFDVATAEPIRNDKGRCTIVKPGEPGLMIMKLPDNLRGKMLYKAGSDATQKKLLWDVFEEGDCYMNFGDALIQDKEYFLYFYDRLGDTFRWKAENVSTQEVANAISSLDFIEEANVYGVAMPGYEGKAGMAAITLNPNVQFGNKELQELYRHVSKQLPLYARPLFIRHIPEAVLTGTFKNKKVDLAKDGYDLNKVNDPLYFIDNENKTYSPLTKPKLSKFMSSKL